MSLYSPGVEGLFFGLLEVGEPLAHRVVGQGKR
jgi:hypothetical protein